MRASEIPTAALILGTLAHLSVKLALICFIFDMLRVFVKLDLICCRPPYSGVNVPDHDMTFQSLSELLQQSVSPFVVSVQAKECGGER